VTGGGQGEGWGQGNGRGEKTEKILQGELLLNLVELQHPTATKSGPLWIAYSSTL
jgi:hypothetical protein